MSLKARIVSAIPVSYQTPWRYHIRRLTHRLERELPFLAHVLKAPRTCVDVGANYGMYTCVLAKMARRVEAFEPIPACAAALRAYFGSTVQVHRVALSSRSGHVTLFTPVRGGVVNFESTGLGVASPDAIPVEVETRRLDEFELIDVSFVKIDVEGHELEVLEGGQHTIARDRPILLVEIEQRHSGRPVADVIAHIETLGYSGHFLVDGILRPVRGFSYEEHQAPYLENVMAAGYINNFFFLPAG